MTNRNGLLLSEPSVEFVVRFAHDDVTGAMHMAFARDKRLTRAAKGLMLEYLMMNNGDVISTRKLAKSFMRARVHDSIKEGVRVLANAQSLLRALGYLELTRKRLADGSWLNILTIDGTGGFGVDLSLLYCADKEPYDHTQNLPENGVTPNLVSQPQSPPPNLVSQPQEKAKTPNLAQQVVKDMCNIKSNYLKDAAASFAQKEGDASLFNANGKGYDWGKTKPTTSRKGSKSDYSAAAAAADAPQEPAQAPQTASKPAKAKKSTGRTKAEKERAQALVVAFDELLQEKYKYSLTSMGKSAWGETKRAAYSLMDAGYSDEHILAAYVYFRSKFKMGDTHMRLSAVQKHIPAYVAKRENTVSAYEGLRRDRSGMNASSNLAKPKGFDEWAVGMIDLAKMMGDDEPTQDELEREYIEHLDEWIKLGHNNQHLESVKRMRDEFAERVVA